MDIDLYEQGRNFLYPRVLDCQEVIYPEIIWRTCELQATADKV